MVRKEETKGRPKQVVKKGGEEKSKSKQMIEKTASPNKWSRKEWREKSRCEPWSWTCPIRRGKRGREGGFWRSLQDQQTWEEAFPASSSSSRGFSRSSTRKSHKKKKERKTKSPWRWRQLLPGSEAPEQRVREKTLLRSFRLQSPPTRFPSPEKERKFREKTAKKAKIFAPCRLAPLWGPGRRSRRCGCIQS